MLVIHNIRKEVVQAGNVVRFINDRFKVNICLLCVSEAVGFVGTVETVRRVRVMVANSYDQLYSAQI